jgi:two-component system sensor histidine kinase PilS (NtrC family)
MKHAVPEQPPDSARAVRGQGARTMLSSLYPSYDGPVSMLWFTGVARIALLVLMVGGTRQMVAEPVVHTILIATYAVALVCGTWYFATLWRGHKVSAALTWTQVFVDFSVVAMTINFTGGQASYFTSLLVIVILEAGVLMGLVQGFMFATVSGVFVSIAALSPGQGPPDQLAHWYNMLVQFIAFFFTAFISGYWNLRLGWMKQFQREILDNMSSGFLFADQRGRVLGANRAACTILDCSQEEVVGRHVESVLVSASGTECPVVTALRERRDYTSYEFPIRSAGGAIRLIGLTTNRLFDRKGQSSTVIVSFSDLTEVARMRQELQHQDRMAVIGELSAELAHEIRNPVTSIRGAMEELRKGPVSGLIAERLAAIAVRESDHLNEIVTGFLDFARNPEMKRQNVSLGGLALEMKRLFEGRHPGLAIAVDADDNEGFVQGDPTQLRQLYLNLVQNAAEAMDFRGNLAVSVRRTGATAVVRFDDEGPGVPPDKVARIFEPFYTGKERGVGMGLAICSRIVTAHNGAIQAAARPGGGASMIVRLPAVNLE